MDNINRFGVDSDGAPTNRSFAMLDYELEHLSTSWNYISDNILNANVYCVAHGTVGPVV
jgi:hypothetical protein